jgi:tripeptide aminopeptidase
MQDPTVSLFFDLVKIDSPTGNEKKVSDFVYKKLKAISNNVYVDKHWNVYAFFQGTGTPIAFSAHFDTVEPGRGIKPLVRKGYAVSDGKTILGADNKAALASLLRIASVLSKNKQHRPVELLLTVGEEKDSRGAMRFDYSKLKSAECLCFDSSNQPMGTIIIGSPAYETVDIHIIGRNAHASKPELGINALASAGTFINGVKMGFFDDITAFNLGIVNGGNVRNTIIGEITLLGEIRGFTESGITSCKKHILSSLKKSSKKHGTKYKISFRRETPPYLLDRESAGKLIGYVERCMVAEGMKPSLKRIWGISDSNTFNSKGILSLNISNGVQNAHTQRERIKISDIERINELMLRLAGAKAVGL